MTAAAMLLAVAAWLGPGPALVRARARPPVRERLPRPGRGPAHAPDPLAVASCLDVLAVVPPVGAHTALHGAQRLAVGVA
ncbi:hypothetical protein A5675_22175 [Mycobacterium malmoense]|nr:hypothetical protein A5675_22175 [Mycobacterium malmoense]